MILKALVLSLMVSQFALQARAAQYVNPLSSKEMSIVEFVGARLSTMSTQERARFLELRNAKGEPAPITPAGRVNEKGLWATLDPTADSVQGTSTEQIYLSTKMPTDRKHEVIVAVIDSGVDIKHEDLQGHLWVNEAEANGVPGVDDDGDGYVDDINGWNFIGGKDGTNVNYGSLESTREYARLTKKLQSEGLSTEEQKLLETVKTKYEEQKSDNEQTIQYCDAVVAAVKLLKANGLKEETVAGLDAVTSTDPAVLRAKQIAGFAFGKKQTSEYLAGISKEYSESGKYQFDLNYDESKIIGDNPEKMDEVGYGNNDVTGPDAMHGTHVSGIIAADRNNGFGIMGQALDVKIMPIRVVPNGDERDKDVANGIRFAVDHGAQIINMSFGKPFSPHKDYVDSAMQYAAEHGVLLVHAAGNDNANNDSFAENFPNSKTIAGIDIATWIEVGASSRTKDAKLPASFSNYGKNSVDVFAPGVDIVSTVPGNKYQSLQGTSMASPEVAGVAAILRSRFPKVSAEEIKEAITGTVNTYDGLQVNKPGSTDLIAFSELSRSGGTVNAKAAMDKLAQDHQTLIQRIGSWLRRR